LTLNYEIVRNEVGVLVRVFTLGSAP